MHTFPNMFRRIVGVPPADIGAIAVPLRKKSAFSQAALSRVHYSLIEGSTKPAEAVSTHF